MEERKKEDEVLKVELIPRILGFVPGLILDVTNNGRDLAIGSGTDV